MEEREKKEGGREREEERRREGRKRKSGRKEERKRKKGEGTQRETPPSPTIEDPSPVLSLEEGFSREN